MEATRGRQAPSVSSRRLTLVVLVAGLVSLVAIGGIEAFPRLRESWLLHRLEHGTPAQRRAALARLHELDSRRAAVLWIGCDPERIEEQLDAVALEQGASSAPETTRLDDGFWVRSDPPRPVSALPDFVTASPGEATLFADFVGAREEGIAVYLVNRTGRPLELPAEDGDLYLKLETASSEGAWQRAQGHAFSTCGNSYQTVALEQETYVRFLGWWPREGTRRRVRYRLHNDLGLVSNVGWGVVAGDQLLACRYDAFAVGAAEEAELERWAGGDLLLSGKGRVEAQVRAVRQLVFKADDHGAIIRLIEAETTPLPVLVACYEVLNTCSSESFEGEMLRALEGENRSRKEAAVRALTRVGPVVSSIRQSLLALAADPQTPDLHALVEYLGTSGEPGDEERLARIAGDRRVPSPAREAARFYLAEPAGRGILRIEGELMHMDPSGIWQPPYEIRLSVTSRGDEPLLLDTARLREFLGVFVRIDNAFIAPRSEGRWSVGGRDQAPETGTGAPLAGGQERVFPLRLLEDFSFPPSAEERFGEVWVSCKALQTGDPPAITLLGSFTLAPSGAPEEVRTGG